MCVSVCVDRSKHTHMHRLIYRPVIPAENGLQPQSVVIHQCQQREHQGDCLGSGTQGGGWSSSLPGGVCISTKPAPRLQNLVWRRYPAPQLESQSKRVVDLGLFIVCVISSLYSRYLENFAQIFKNVFLLKFSFFFF